MMNAQNNPGSDFDRALDYHIRIKGRLDDDWADWFGGLTLSAAENNETLITARAFDQPALHGLLRKVCDLGLVLVSLNPADEPSNE